MVAASMPAIVLRHRHCCNFLLTVVHAHATNCVNVIAALFLEEGKMAYEVDLLGVGAESQSGDAIAVRFGQPDGSMPSWIDRNGSDQGAANIGLHAQENLPGGVPGGLLIFQDGFESGDLTAWSAAIP